MAEDEGAGGAEKKEQPPLVWEVNWRNVQTKKNKTWEEWVEMYCRRAIPVS